MSSGARDTVVFDCNVFLQYLLNQQGPGGRCVRLALADEIELFVSDSVIDELFTLPHKQVCIELGVDQAVVNRFIKETLQHATVVREVPDVYCHPIDEKDSCYVNLAVAVGAKLIVSRDNHLLNLTNPAKAWSKPFRDRFPDIRVLRPDEYLRERRLRANRI